MVKIGNIGTSSPPKRPKIGAGLGLKDRFKRLSTTALDRGEAQAKSAIEDLLPGPEELAPALNESEQEQVIQGLSMVMGALAQARGREAHRARQVVRGLYAAVAGMSDSVDGEGVEVHGHSYEGSAGFVQGSGNVDVIGLEPHSGGFVRPGDDDQWR